MGWQDISTAPKGRRVLVDFEGAGPIVAYRDEARPDMWVRYLGYGKSELWPAIHEDYAKSWTDIPPPARDSQGRVRVVEGTGCGG